LGGGIQSSSRPGHHLTSARHCSKIKVSIFHTIVQFKVRADIGNHPTAYFNLVVAVGKVVFYGIFP